MTAPSIKHFSSAGALGDTRRPVAKAETVPSASDPESLVRSVRRLSKRLDDMELANELQPGWSDFEMDVSTGGATVTMMHDYGTPVRWYVVHWGKTATVTPTAAPALVMDSTSTLNILVLKSYVAGKAVIRVEPTPYPVAY